MVVWFQCWRGPFLRDSDFLKQQMNIAVILQTVHGVRSLTPDPGPVAGSRPGSSLVEMHPGLEDPKQETRPPPNSKLKKRDQKQSFTPVVHFEHKTTQRKTQNFFFSGACQRVAPLVTFCGMSETFLTPHQFSLDSFVALVAQRSVMLKFPG